MRRKGKARTSGGVGVSMWSDNEMFILHIGNRAGSGHELELEVLVHKIPLCPALY